MVEENFQCEICFAKHFYPLRLWIDVIEKGCGWFCSNCHNAKSYEEIDRLRIRLIILGHRNLSWTDINARIVHILQMYGGIHPPNDLREKFHSRSIEAGRYILIYDLL